MKWRKLAYALTGAVFTLILSFSWISWADNKPVDDSLLSENNVNSTPAGASNGAGEITFLDQETRKVIIFNGKQKYTYQLSEQTQVLINEKSADFQQIELGAHAEVIQNSAGDVRYLRVEQKVAQSTSTAKTSKPTNPLKPVSTIQSPISDQTVSFPWEKWKLDLHQGNIKVKLEWEKDDAEVEWKTPQKEMKLHGEQAKKFILAWYKDSGLLKQKEQEQLVYEMLKSFDIQTDKPFSCTIEWKQDGQSGKWTVHPKDQGKDKDKGKEKHKNDDDDDDDDD